MSMLLKHVQTSLILMKFALAHVYVEIRNSISNKIFTEIKRNFWGIWELRLMVMVSLILQLVLIKSGNLRKRYIGKKLHCIAIIVWLVYLSANWMATLVLSTLLRGNVKLQDGLVVLWTPFLLWHLGSPVNITAFSLEDNDMWLRHFFAMAVQVLETIYIYIRFQSHPAKSQSDTVFKYLAALIFLTGVVKYGEKIWALRSASEKQLVNSVCSYEEKVSGPVKNIRKGLPESRISFEGRYKSDQLNLLREAYSSFTILKPLFLDLQFELSSRFYDDMVYMKSKSADQAFELVGIELRYLYDLLFTKMSIHQHKESLYPRVFCFLSVVSSLIAFSAIEKSLHHKVDIVITYLLLLGAIFVDVHSFIVYASSKWTTIWLPDPQNRVQKWYSMAVASRMHYSEGKMAIKSMAQHDLINYYVKSKKNKIAEAVRIIDTGNLLQKHRHTYWKAVDSEMKKFIYSYLEEKRRKWDEDKNFDPDELEELLNGKAKNIFAKAGINNVDFEMDATDFTQLIFSWHFATELLYYEDVDRFHRSGNLGQFCQIAKTLSDYLMYLVLVRPLMLPKGLSDVINKDNYIQAKNFFPDKIEKVTRKNFIQSRKRFIAAVLSRDCEGALDVGKSFEVITSATTTARQLQGYWRDHEDKWEMISKVWMEMMIHAASHCSWKEHAQQLRHGGELLTHVALLMAHLGLTTHIHKEEDAQDEFSMPPI